MKKSISWIFILGMMWSIVFAQEKTDSNSFRSFWTQGTINGQIRSQYMGTYNRDYLDFQTIAMGGYLKYKTKRTKGIQLVLAAHNSNRIWESNMLEVDPKGGKSARWEPLNYDITNISNRSVFVLGEAYFSYQNKWLDFKAGRFDMETPMVAAQKGFFIPLYSQGAKAIFKVGKQLRLGAYYQNAQIPLGGGDFYSIVGTINVHPSGRNILGKKATYQGLSRSDGMLAASIDYKAKKGFYFKTYNYYFDNLMNTWFSQMGYELKINEQWKNKLELQYFNQSLVGNGGNEDLSLRYYDNLKPTHIFGARYSFYSKNHKFIVAFNRITDDGKFIFNRGWGVEPFFTFQTRERVEGQSNHTSMLLAYEYKKQFEKFKTKLHLSYGYKDNGGVNDPTENRYGLPSYHHLAMIYNIQFTHKNWSGLGAQWRVVGKVPLHQNYTDRQLMNNVNLIHTTFALFYNF